MTMTAEQLEELLRRSLFSEEDFRQLSSMATSLARRVIAAEKLVEALEVMRDTTNRAGMYDYADNALTAYREASK